MIWLAALSKSPTLPHILSKPGGPANKRGSCCKIPAGHNINSVFLRQRCKSSQLERDAHVEARLCFAMGRTCDQQLPPQVEVQMDAKTQCHFVHTQLPFAAVVAD